MQTLATSWNLGNSATTKWYARLFPSLNDIAFLLPIIVLFAKMKGTQLLFADGDTGWHIRTGEWILSHHAVPAVDLFSFTMPNQPWFAWEWGWDVVFAAIHSVAGLGGVGFVTTIMLGLFTLLVYRLALRVSQNNLMSMAVTVLTAAVSSIHWLARPHLVSWLFMLLFLNAVESARLGHVRALYMLPLLMVCWVNVHGGFVAGLIVLACYGAGEALSEFFESERSAIGTLVASAWRRSAAYWQCFACCFAATLVNPYGWLLHKHVFAYLSNAELLDQIQEFQSISFHAAPAIFFEVMLLLGAMVVFSRVRRLEFSPVLLICFWGHYALLSARHIPLFMAATAPFAAKLLSDGLAKARSIGVVAEAADVVDDIAHDLRTMEVTPRLHVASGAAILLIAALFAVGKTPFTPEFSADTFPVAAIPVLERKGTCRVFTSDQWGDYLLYRLYPAQRVFFDGRSDFYGNDFVKVNRRIAGAEHDWKSLLEHFGINIVVVKPESPLSAVLKLSPGVKVLLDDGKVIVFDTSGLYPRISEKGDTAKRAASYPQMRQPALRGVVVTLKQPSKLEKGKSS